MPQITTLLSAYNEEVAIGSVDLCTCQFADRVIVVDDGSSDRTAEVAALAGAEVICHISEKHPLCAQSLNLIRDDTDSIMLE